MGAARGHATADTDDVDNVAAVAEAADSFFAFSVCGDSAPAPQRRPNERLRLLLLLPLPPGLSEPELRICISSTRVRMTHSAPNRRGWWASGGGHAMRPECTALHAVPRTP